MEKINKTRAQKEFINGNSILIIPCKMRINSPWCIGYTMNVTDENVKSDVATEMIINGTAQNDAIKLVFERLINSYSYYACNSECGKYLHYYLK